MSTTSINTDNSPAQFASVSELARMLRLDKAGVSRRVARLEKQGLVETRAGAPGEPKLVNVAAYLAAIEQTTDAIRAANGAVAKADAPADPTLAAQQSRLVAIRAELAQIDLDKARGLLLPLADVREAMAHAAGRLVRGLEALVGRAGDFTAAVARDGEPGMRAALKEAVRDLRERLALDMTAAATEMPEDGDE